MRLQSNKALFAFLLSLWLGWTSFGQTLQVDRLKANYLIAFVDFARWEGELKSKTATIGVIGNKDLAQELRKITRNKSEGRKLNILSLKANETDRLAEVDILFIGSKPRKQRQRIMDNCKNHTLLMVGEQKSFIAKGGAIQFVFRRNRLRFYVEPQNAESHKVELSSKLIELAIE